MFFISLSAFRQIFATIATCMTVMVSGTVFGWTAPALVMLRSEGSDIQMTHSEAAWMVSIMSVGDLVSPIPAGILSDRYGRKPVILSTGPIYIIAWTIMVFCKTLIFLCVARVLQGLATGIVFTIVPMYLGEISTTRNRGSVTSMFQTSLYAGFLYEYFIGPFVSYNLLLCLSLLLPLVFMALFIWLPESPHFYAMVGKLEDAEKSLMWLRATTNSDNLKKELAEITETIEDKISNKTSWKEVVAKPSDRRALIISLVLVNLRVFSGSNAITSYSTLLFAETGFKLISASNMTMILGSVLFISSFFSTALIDHIGRKPLLISSTIGCAISLGIVSIYFYLFENTDFDVTEFSWVCPVCVIAYNLCLAFGLGPISMTYRSELFPANTRSTASSINSINFSIGFFATLKLYQVISDSLGTYFVFAVFSVSCFLGTIWMAFYAIETKDKTLAEIQEELAQTSGYC